MSKTVLCRLPNHVGDCMMTLPALQLLADSGFTPSLIGKRFAEDLMAGMGWRYDPIEGQVLKDLGRVKEIAQNTGDSPRGVLFPNSFGSALLFKLGGIRSAGYNALRTDLLDCNYVSSISFTEDTTELFDNLIVSLGYVVVLIIICAAALAAVVLYNLISVNLGERKKELATIKVLGFYDQEVYRYIFREIELLALIGSGVGLALGVPLHKFIVLTVEMDQLMFIRTIAPRSYLLAVALTMLFTVVVCFVMRRHVRRISMVESMKAPE